MVHVRSSSGGSDLSEELIPPLLPVREKILYLHEGRPTKIPAPTGNRIRKAAGRMRFARRFLPVIARAQLTRTYGDYDEGTLRLDRPAARAGLLSGRAFALLRPVRRAVRRRPQRISHGHVHGEHGPVLRAAFRHDDRRTAVARADRHVRFLPQADRENRTSAGVLVAGAARALLRLSELRRNDVESSGRDGGSYAAGHADQALYVRFQFQL